MRLQCMYKAQAYLHLVVVLTLYYLIIFISVIHHIYFTYFSILMLILRDFTQHNKEIVSAYLSLLLRRREFVGNCDGRSRRSSPFLQSSLVRTSEDAALRGQSHCDKTPSSNARHRRHLRRRFTLLERNTFPVIYMNLYSNCKRCEFGNVILCE